MLIVCSRVFFHILLVIGLGFISTEVYSQPTTKLKLPPSLERELRLRGKGASRVVRFSDTLKADKLISQSLRDSLGEELDTTMVHDSAIVLIDSSVSLSHKEWLDSMLTELPETSRTPEGLRFHYPDEMMVNTSRRQVPFDANLVHQMDPVSKEDLPLFTDLPMQKPIELKGQPMIRFEAGGGSPYFPIISADVNLLHDERKSIRAGASYVNRIGSSAIRSEWKLRGEGRFLLSTTPPDAATVEPEIRSEIRIGSLSREVATDTMRNEYSLVRTSASAEASFGSLRAIKMMPRAMLQYLGDNIASGLNERTISVSTTMEHQSDDSSHRLGLEIGYATASGTTDKVVGNTSLSEATIEATVSSNTTSSFWWKLGATAISANDIDGSIWYLFPSIRVGEHLTDSWSLYGSVLRTATLNNFNAIYNTNPFYSPFEAGREDRRVAIGKYNAELGTDYFISRADKLHAAIGYTDTKNAVVFHKISDTISRFTTSVLNTKIISVTLGANLLLFGNDRLSINTEMLSNSSSEGDSLIGYLPTTVIDAQYIIGSLSEVLIPTVAMKMLSRRDKTLLYFNVSGEYMLSKHWSLNLGIENIMGVEGDYWDSYEEYPRTIRILVKGDF